MQLKLTLWMYVIDPPSGWQYGFPALIHDKILFGGDNIKSKWFRLQGYPENLIELGLRHSRYWSVRVTFKEYIKKLREAQCLN